MLLVSTLALLVSPARGQDQPGPDESGVAPVTSDYRTPLAGQPYEADVFGRHIVVEERDRSFTTAITLGTSYFYPPIGSQRIVPFAALYVNGLWETRRLRATIAALVNDIDYGEGVQATGFEALFHFENNTIPFSTTEIIDGKDVDNSDVYYGTVNGGPGFGYRARVWPFEVDNDLRLELLTDIGYFYVKRTRGTFQGNLLPPDTVTYGPHFRARIDCLRRNLLELPHFGFAAGFDASFTRRDHWTDQGTPGVSVFARLDTRDFVKIYGYAVLAGGLPLLSERHRFVVQIHGGTAPYGKLDRFSTFRLGGGPPTTEAGDLARSPYPGAMFDQFATREYVLGSLEYRLEVLFFLYLHVRATLVWGEVPTFDRNPGVVTFTHDVGETVSIGITSGFVWSSSIYVEYTYDLGLVRGNKAGNTVLLSWSKNF
ncbi:hypothetical protein HY251_17685 [bacterium]|nr:hypothetical protein [bacterium]